MSRVYYERLSEESAEYLNNESSRLRAHTAMILVFEAGPLATEDGGIDFERIREIVRMRLPELPRLRTKLRRVPVDGHPVWVDDQEFNLDFHLRQSSLPRPGNHDQLCRTASRIAATKLDRSRPLWDCWVIEGLESGHFALVLKMHKALAHLEGADLFRAILQASEDRVTGSVSRYRARPAPSPLELFSAEVLRSFAPSRRVVGRTMRLLFSPEQLSREARGRARGLLKIMGYQLRPAGESPFDGNLSPHRSFSVHEVDLAGVQAIRQSLGGSVHDVVLTLLTGALRRYVQELRISPTNVDLRAVTPILDASEKSADAWLVELPLWEETAASRHEVISEQSRRIRLEADVASGDSLVQSAQWNAATLFAIGARALKEIDAGQIGILQSPGPQQPLYLDGARLVESYGILPLQGAAGLGITVLGYGGSLFFAFNCDPDIVRDIDRLRDALDTEAAELLSMADARGPNLRAVGGTSR
jgi:WS/DGAT/MGAT family acyltransferase